MATEARSPRRYLGRLALLYGLLCTVTLAIPGCSLGAMSVAEGDGGCGALVGAMIVVVAAPFVLVGWLLHLLALGFFSWSRHRAAGLGSGPDIATHAAAAAVLALGSVRVGMTLLDEPMPGPGDELFVVDAGAIVVATLLGALAGWRTGTWARRS